MYIVIDKIHHFLIMSGQLPLYVLFLVKITKMRMAAIYFAMNNGQSHLTLKCGNEVY